MIMIMSYWQEQKKNIIAFGFGEVVCHSCMESSKSSPVFLHHVAIVTCRPVTYYLFIGSQMY